MNARLSGWMLGFALLLGGWFSAGCDKRKTASPHFLRPINLVYLDQGDRWGPEQRARYYYTPQGTMLHNLRYSWFQHLEGPEGRLADPAHLSQFGFLYSPEQFGPDFDGGELNPGNFPVGFAMHKDELSGDAMLDITCAACHTGQLEYKGVALRVDGGQPMHAFAWVRPGQLLIEMLLALQTTFIDPLKFDSFAQKVLGKRYPDGKRALKEQLAKSLDGFNHEAITTIGIYRDHGYGRLDALGRIADTVLGDDLDTGNSRPTDAPVSYPHLWDIWKFDWVQWNGSVASPMGRNVGEALGVKARLDLVDEQGKALPPGKIYSSSVLLREQYCIETTLWSLQAPRWPEHIFPKIDEPKAVRGAKLFGEHCQGCHGPHVYPEYEPPLGQPEMDCDHWPDIPPAQVAPVRYECEVLPGEQKPTPCKPVEWKMCVVPAWDIGTDPQVVNNYLDARYDASALDPAQPRLRKVSAGAALDLMMNAVGDKKVKDLTQAGLLDEEGVWNMRGWGRKNEMRDIRGYKARPLHGIWATPPFLHNGSVRTIYELLSPHSEREKKMWMGSREFDPVHVGYRNEKTAWSWELDTQELGNRNTGHQFTDAGGAGVIGPALSHDERLALIEYLKILGNPKYDHDYQDYDVSAGDVVCPSDLEGPASQAGARWPR